MYTCSSSSPCRNTFFMSIWQMTSLHCRYRQQHLDNIILGIGMNVSSQLMSCCYGQPLTTSRALYQFMEPSTLYFTLYTTFIQLSSHLWGCQPGSVFHFQLTCASLPPWWHINSCHLLHLRSSSAHTPTLPLPCMHNDVPYSHCTRTE